MAHIPSANPDFDIVNVPGTSTGYIHGMASRQTFIPLAFQVTSPYNNTRVLMPHALVMHVNPQNYSEQHTKKIERIQTRGGWVEQHWGDELTEITCDGSTGAFMNIYTGLSSLLRQRTIAWDRYRDLHDLFRNNGSLYDPYGNIVLQGNIMLMYDRGTYLGGFRTWEVEETDDQPFAFKVSWTFKVENELMKIPNLISNPNQRGTFSAGAAPSFQGQNVQATASSIGTNSTGGLTAPQQAASISQASFNQQANAITANATATTSAPGVGQTAVDGIGAALGQFVAGNITQSFQTLASTNAQVAGANAAPTNPNANPAGKT
jgi:hypothetical protein